MLAWGRRGIASRSPTELARAVEALGVSPDVAVGEAARRGTAQGDPLRRRRRPRGAARRSKEAASARAPQDAYDGIVPRLEERLARSATCASRRADEDDPDADEGGIADDELGRFLVTRTCDACKGKRLRPEALAVKLGGKDIAQVGAMPLRHVRKFVESLGSSPGERHAAAGVRPRASGPSPSRCSRRSPRASASSSTSGLDYLTLDRSAQTLSVGEGQRIRLATQIGAALVGVLYVLDEPSVGLHARDNARLIEAQARLRDLGNTVIVVEHDREAILAADHVVDMGPGAGVHGGDDRRAGDAARDHGQPQVDHRPVAQRRAPAPRPVEAASARTKAMRPRRRRARAQPART